MATHQEIEALEAPLVDTLNNIRHKRPFDPDHVTHTLNLTLQALSEERQQSRFGNLKSDNYNHWGTLGVNVVALESQTLCPNLKNACQLVAKALGKPLLNSPTVL